MQRMQRLGMMAARSARMGSVVSFPRREIHGTPANQAAVSSSATLPAVQKYNASHYLSMALAAAVPAAILIPSGSAMLIPVDLVLAVGVPAHAVLGMELVINDYAPRPLQKLLNASVLGVFVLVSLGLLKVTLFGPGLTTSVKGLWKKNKD